MALRGKVAIVTGSSSGIGAAIARCFAQEGALVTITGRREKKLQTVAEQCERHSQAKVHVVPGDITDRRTRTALVEKTKEKYGKIDILVNNAGVVAYKTLMEETKEEYERTMDTNLHAPVFLSRLAAPHLITSQGSIINISSISSTMPSAVLGSYAMSKSALDMFTKTFAHELGPHGVRVNSINPGFTSDTDIHVDTPEDLAERVTSRLPLRRAGTSEDVARTAVFLASESSSYITGSIIIIDGGMVTVPAFM